jgi:hypothetical protein
MIEISVIRDLVAIFGVIAGFTYYVLTVRNAQKGQRTADETRQLQTVMQLSSMASYEGSKIYIELLNMEWNDYEDFERKYGSDTNTDNFAKRQAIWRNFDALGLALKRGLIDRELFFEQNPYGALLIWAKFRDVIKEIRRRYNQPLLYVHFEYLTEETHRYIQERGLDASVPGTFLSYVPEQ